MDDAQTEYNNSRERKECENSNIATKKKKKKKNTYFKAFFFHIIFIIIIIFMWKIPISITSQDAEEKQKKERGMKMRAEESEEKKNTGRFFLFFSINELKAAL